MGAALVLSACGQAGGADADATSAPTLDCTLARTAMDDYSIALTDLATSLEAGDPMSAVAAADAISYALDQLESALPSIPAEGQAFLAGSREVALSVKQSVAESPQMTGLLGELTSAFADPAFAAGGEAIDGYVNQQGPAPSESGTP